MWISGGRNCCAATDGDAEGPKGAHLWAPGIAVSDKPDFSRGAGPTDSDAVPPALHPRPGAARSLPLHYSWPLSLSIPSPSFSRRFAQTPIFFLFFSVVTFTPAVSQFHRRRQRMEDGQKATRLLAT